MKSLPYLAGIFFILLIFNIKLVEGRDKCLILISVV